MTKFGCRGSSDTIGVLVAQLVFLVDEVVDPGQHLVVVHGHTCDHRRRSGASRWDNAASLAVRRSHLRLDSVSHATTVATCSTYRGQRSWSPWR